MRSTSPALSGLQPLLCRLRPDDAVERTEPLGGGNSLVLRLELASGHELIAKRYADRGPDRLDPLEVETRALDFFERHGLGRVPRQLGSDRQRRWALMSVVPGQPVDIPDVHGLIGDRDVRSLLDFLATLDRLGAAPGAAELPAASEASFSLTELRRDIDRRLRRLRQRAGPADRQADDMLSWLDSRLEPAFRDFVDQAQKRLSDHGLAEDDRLPETHRRLSPSDVGFHNGLRDDGGRWSFVDFEYFGWDDPAKTICDLLLHPRAGMPEHCHRLLVGQRLRALDGDSPLPHRLRAYFPLFAVKWCLILLNEFLPCDRSRRRRAGAGVDIDPRPRQLERARRRLEALVDRGLPEALT